MGTNVVWSHVLVLLSDKKNLVFILIYFFPSNTLWDVSKLVQ